MSNDDMLVEDEKEEEAGEGAELTELDDDLVDDDLFEDDPLTDSIGLVEDEEIGFESDDRDQNY